MRTNALIIQSGGPTAVINASAVGVISACLSSSMVDRVYAAQNGILGVLSNSLICLNQLTEQQLSLLKTTPAAAFGSCRYHLPRWQENDSDYLTIFHTLFLMKIGMIFYIGGNDSMDTAMKLSEYACSHRHPVVILGIPKTIDNDLTGTDHCPGYGSAAKYIATSVMEICRDAQVYQNDLITIVEVMGRNAGWLAASAALATNRGEPAADLIYLPEVPFDTMKCLEDLKQRLKHKHHVLIAVAEGIKTRQGAYLKHQAAAHDGFCHEQLGGTAEILQRDLQRFLAIRIKSIELNVLQRCAAHCLSQTDVEEAFHLGERAVYYAERGETGMMVGLRRIADVPYQTEISLIPLAEVANHEKTVPLEWIVPSHNYVSQACIRYMAPLIAGEVVLRYESGLPVFAEI